MRRKKAEWEEQGAAYYTVLQVDLYQAAKFKQKNESPFATLSDPAGYAFAAYGLAKHEFFRGEWLNWPGVFVIDRKGIVTFAWIGRQRGRPAGDVLVGEVKKAAR